LEIDRSSGLDVAIVGGGIVGLFVAWRVRERGLPVAVFDAGDDAGVAWPVAAGMLAPISEAQFGAHGERAVTLGLAAAARWPQAARELGEASGIDPQLRDAGTMMLARDRVEDEALEREDDLRERLGLPFTRLLPSAARAIEPALAPTLRGALDVPGGVIEQLQSDGLAIGLRRRRVDRSVADEVGVVGHRVDLPGRVGGQADEDVGPDDLTRLGHRRVVLADVHAVGAGGRGDVGPVVDDEQRPRLRAQVAGDRARGQQRVVGRRLVAQLEQVGAARKGGLQNLGQRSPAGPGVGDEVQACAAQALAAVHAN
jgi:hypothetical protein